MREINCTYGVYRFLLLCSDCFPSLILLSLIVLLVASCVSIVVLLSHYIYSFLQQGLGLLTIIVLSNNIA